MDAVLQEGEEGQALQGALYARLPPGGREMPLRLLRAVDPCKEDRGGPRDPGPEMRGEPPCEALPL